MIPGHGRQGSKAWHVVVFVVVVFVVIVFVVVVSVAAKKFIFEEEKIRFGKLFPFTRSMQQFPVFQICLPPNVILQSERQEPLRLEKTD